MSWLSEWIGGKAKPTTQPPPPPTNSVKDLFSAGLDGVFDKTITLFRSSSVGQAVETTATKQAIGDFFRNPLVLVGLAALAVVIVTRR